MARGGNRVIKQKSEKGKKVARDVRKGRQLGMRNPEDYRKEAVNINTRPSKAEREADAVAAAKGFAEKAEKGPKAPNVTPIGDLIKIKPGEMESSATGVGLVSKRGKARAQAQAAAQNVGLGLSTVNKEGKEKPVTGRERASVLNELRGTRSEYIKERNKREKAADTAATKRAVDLREPGWKRKPTTKKPKKGKVLNEPKVGVSASEGLKPQGGTRNIIPGEGSAGILSLGNVARTPGEVGRGRRRRLERKALYNMKNAGKTKGYKGASELAGRAAEAINTKNEQVSQDTDLRARKRAAKIDTKKDVLKESIKKRAQEREKSGKISSAQAIKIKEAADTIIREPKVENKDGTTYRPGPKKVVEIPDPVDLTKTYIREMPVGAPRLTEQTSRLSDERIKMDRGGSISIQPNKPIESGIGLLGSHEDRLHALTKWLQVPTGEKDSNGNNITKDLEPKYLRSYMKSKSEGAKVRYNERDIVGALFHAKHHSDKNKFDTIHKEVLAHRQKRIGTEIMQREAASAKAAQKRAMEKESRGGKRQSPRALRVVSNVSNKFTEIPNGETKA